MKSKKKIIILIVMLILIITGLIIYILYDKNIILNNNNNIKENIYYKDEDNKDMEIEITDTLKNDIRKKIAYLNTKNLPQSSQNTTNYFNNLNDSFSYRFILYKRY